MANDRWRTPIDVFRRLEREMKLTFSLDPCTSEDNPLNTPKFYTKENDGLSKSWCGECVFMNPPYSRKNIDKWVKKANMEANEQTLVVGLLPLRTANWFKNYILPKGKIIRDLEEWQDLERGECGIFFWESRMRFIDPDTGVRVKQSPTWDTIIVVWV